MVSNLTQQIFMKKLYLVLLGSIIIFLGKAQKIDSAAYHKLTPENQHLVDSYFRQSRGLRTGGIIFSVIGGGLIIGGIASIISETNTGDLDYSTGATLIGIGIFTGCGSIPFFVMGHKRKKDAERILYSLKKKPGKSPFLLAGVTSSGFTLSVPIGR